MRFLLSVSFSKRLSKVIFRFGLMLFFFVGLVSLALASLFHVGQPCHFTWYAILYVRSEIPHQRSLLDTWLQASPPLYNQTWSRCVLRTRISKHFRFGLIWTFFSTCMSAYLKVEGNVSLHSQMKVLPGNKPLSQIIFFPLLMHVFPITQILDQLQNTAIFSNMRNPLLCAPSYQSEMKINRNYEDTLSRAKPVDRFVFPSNVFRIPLI